MIFKNEIPDNPAVINYIFHLYHNIRDTNENRIFVKSLADNPNNYLGKDSWGFPWYAKILENGTQAWSKLTSKGISSAGIVVIPREFGPVKIKSHSYSMPLKNEVYNKQIYFRFVYKAVLRVLDFVWERNNCIYLANLLSDISKRTWEAAYPIDRKIISDWEDATKSDWNVTVYTGAQYLINFLRMHDTRTETTHITQLIEEDFEKKGELWEIWLKAFQAL